VERGARDIHGVFLLHAEGWVLSRRQAHSSDNHTNEVPHNSSSLTTHLVHGSSQRDVSHSAWRRNTRTCLESAREPCVLEWKSMRRLFILGVALSVFTAGLVPLSVCAMLSSGAAECAQVTTQSPCDHMQSHKGGAQLSSGSNNSCCAISQAPLPEMQYKAAEVNLVATTVTVTVNLLAVLPARPSSALLVVVENPSPPSLQSLFCTFLI